jgi:hypothetical protein
MDETLNGRFFNIKKTAARKSNWSSTPEKLFNWVVSGIFKTRKG